MSSAEKRLEILYEGYFYDVTEFVKRHPGGNVILFYTEKGEDATQAIQQFHNRFINKINLMLKSFHRRPASDSEVSDDPGRLKRHRGLTDDFAKLFVDITKEGLFEPSYGSILWRMWECCFFWAMAVLLINSSSFPLQLLGCGCFAMGSGRGGWLMHEGGHHSLTGNHRVDRFLESVFIGIFLGLSGGWWSRGHNKHHAMPQRLHYDVDLNTMPFLAYNAKVVKNPDQGKSFLIQNQTWLFLSMDCFFGYWAWRIYICPRNAIKRGDYLDLVMMAIHWYAAYSMIPNWWTFCLSYWLGANYMFGNFALSHTHLPVTEEQTHWVEYGLTHTANVKSTPFVDWWMGMLNFQIEHHLFPTLPQFRAHLVQDRVKALAAKYDLPYHDIPYKDAWIITLKNFSDVAKQFRE
ncbi:acyl-lipid (8-3)-desaturase-like [Folsomia candida]|nr:acyl-lipid (8-3)-desaturase-like [Folsomia candida]